MGSLHLHDGVSRRAAAESWLPPREVPEFRDAVGVSSFRSDAGGGLH
jgi:hypothetical protein